MCNLDEMIDRIKKVKKSKNISNESLSELSGIPKGTLAKILGSETKDPQVSNIVKIAQALEVTTDYIFFGKECPTISKFLSDHEKAVILSYRSKPEMQKAVDILLSVPEDDTN